MSIWPIKKTCYGFLWRVYLSNLIHSTMHSSIGFIDGMLIKIQKPQNDVALKVWLNWCKKPYLINNTMVVENQGLFIYLDFRYLRFHHNVTILQ